MYFTQYFDFGFRTLIIFMNYVPSFQIKGVFCNVLVAVNFGTAVWHFLIISLSMGKHGKAWKPPYSTNRIYSKNFNCFLLVCYKKNLIGLKFNYHQLEIKSLEKFFSQHVIKVTVRLTLGCNQMIKLLILWAPLCDSNCSVFPNCQGTQIVIFLFIESKEGESNWLT